MARRLEREFSKWPRSIRTRRSSPFPLQHDHDRCPCSQQSVFRRRRWPQKSSELFPSCPARAGRRSPNPRAFARGSDGRSPRAAPSIDVLPPSKDLSEPRRIERNAGHIPITLSGDDSAGSQPAAHQTQLIPRDILMFTECTAPRDLRRPRQPSFEGRTRNALFCRSVSHRE